MMDERRTIEEGEGKETEKKALLDQPIEKIWLPVMKRKSPYIVRILTFLFCFANHLFYLLFMSVSWKNE
jgi:hypothetical protein